MNPRGGVATPPRFPRRATLARRQARALVHLLREVLPGNAFYRTRLPHLLEELPEHPPPDPAALLARLPLTTKAELTQDQEAHPPYGTNLTYPVESYTRCHETSGTTGRPLRWLDTPASWRWALRSWQEVLRISGVGPGDRVFFPFSFGPFIGFWTAFEAAEALGCLCLPGGGMSSAARLRAIMEHRATVVCCTPTYALRLAEVAREVGMELQRSAVRRLLLAGEAGAGIPSVRARIEAAWPGAAVRDHHGMTETGPVSFECPARQGWLHVREAAFIPEVLDTATLHAAPPDAVGELVLTGLGRIGSPLLRYRTGDLVRRGPVERCACGRYDLALPGGILGRADDMVVVRGVNLYPTAVDGVVRGCEGVEEYRVSVSRRGALTEVTLEVEAVAGYPDPRVLAAQVEARLRDAFHLRVPVTAVPCGALPRFELKARRWRRAGGDAAAGPAAGPGEETA